MILFFFLKKDSIKKSLKKRFKLEYILSLSESNNSPSKKKKVRKKHFKQKKRSQNDEISRLRTDALSHSKKVAGW